MVDSDPSHILTSPAPPPAAEDTLLEDAERLFHEALALTPQTPEELHMLALAAQEAALSPIAENILRRVLAIDPHHAASHHLLGCALRDQGFYDSSLPSFQQALALDPRRPVFHTDLADAFRRLGRMEDSRRHCEQALLLDATSADAHFMFGCLLYRIGGFDEALAAFQRAVALDPTHAAARRSLAVSFFLRGNFSAGYDHYDWRWSLKGFRGYLQHIPWWNGESLAGKTLLLHAEQGLGDTLQFIRYIPLIKKENTRLILQSQPSLTRLLSRFPGVDAIIPRGDPLPPIDVRCPLLSLPRLFATTLETIPRTVPYIPLDHVAPPDPRVGRNPHCLNVGLAWSGNPRHSEDHLRSIPFAALGPLLDTPNVRFHRLHTRVATESDAPTHDNLLDPTPRFTDFADTAAYVRDLDLIISVDTAIAHLAGAMAKPVWILLPFAPDWRWMLHRADTPWYPTMRLFRQPSFGDWRSVLGHVRSVLDHVAARR